MFEVSFPIGEHQDLLRAREAAFAVVRNAARSAVSRGTAPNRSPAQMVALHVWSLTHGFATLFSNHGDSSRCLLTMSPEDLLKAGLMIYLQSLGLQHAV